MLYFLHGTDTKKSREKLHELLLVLQKKQPDASVFRVESETFEVANFDEFIAGQGLFMRKYIVVCDKLFENKEAKEYVVSHAEEIAHSDNVFLMLEGETDAATIKKIEKFATKVQEFEVRDAARSRAFNTFALADALCARDRAALFTLYTDAKLQSVPVEDVFNILLWQTKALLIASQTSSASESGLKPFVYEKSLRASKKFSLPELQDLSFSLVSLYHDVRRGKTEFEVGLEKLILTV